MPLSDFYPFFVTILGYSYWYIPTSQPGLPALILKVLPIISLWHTVSTAAVTSYQRNIAYGLLASAVGDAALVWNSLFVVGMVAFAIGHSFYILALASRTTVPADQTFSRLTKALFLYGITVLVWWTVLRPGLQEPELKFGVPVYILWLTTTVWRASCVGDWSMFLGSALFMISDFCIGINQFYTELYYAQVMIMSTYYAAQLFIARSAMTIED